MKQQATYEFDERSFIRVGDRASVFCCDHQRQELCNRPVHTSKVVSYDPLSGTFETLNTIYKIENLE